MGGEWREATLGELCSFVAGSVFPKEFQGENAGAYPFIKVSDMNLPGNERWVESANHWISQPTKEELRARVHPAGATVFAKIGVALTYNRRRMLRQPTIVDNNMMSAVPDIKRVNPLLFYYLLRTLDFNDVVCGTALPYLNTGDLRRLPVLLPPLPEQHAIADILGSLDDKIELNRRTNETLEAMARALFKSWFVDFDPVVAKSEGRQPEGMDAETARLFPSSFQDSEIGRLPKGWKVGAIGDCVTVVGGSTPSTSDPSFWGGTRCFCTPKDLSTLSSPVLLDTERKVTDKGVGEIGSGLLPPGAVLLSSRAPIGYLVVTEVPTAVNQGFIAMVCDKALPNLYVLRWTEANMDVIKGRANGTTFLEISKTAFRPIKAIVPRSGTVSAYVQLVSNLHATTVNNLRENLSLAASRDTLLPSLLAGKIRVQH